MNKRYTPVISSTVTVPVVGSIKDAGGKPVPFKFSLTCNRISASEMKNRITAGGVEMKDIMKEVTTAWSGQRLIVDEETGQPAEFSEESFDALLDIGGMAMVCLSAFNKESSAHEKN
jgi:hypothetical protein